MHNVLNKLSDKITFPFQWERLLDPVVWLEAGEFGQFPPGIFPQITSPDIEVLVLVCGQRWPFLGSEIIYRDEIRQKVNSLTDF